MVSAFTESPTGNTSFSKSAALANGLKDAHFVSRYSISGLVCPLSQVLIGRNVWGPSVWRAHRFPLVRSSVRERAGGVGAPGGADPDRARVDDLADALGGELAAVAAALRSAERETRVRGHDTVDE